MAKKKPLPPEDKKKIAKYAQRFGDKSAADQFGESRSTIRSWRLKLNTNPTCFDPPVGIAQTPSGPEPSPVDYRQEGAKDLDILLPLSRKGGLKLVRSITNQLTREEKIDLITELTASLK